MTSLRNTVAVLVAGVLGAAVFAGTAISQATFEPARVAFLDMARVFNEYERPKKIQERVRADLARLDEALRTRYEELKKKQDELDILEPGSKEYESARKAIDFDAFKLEYDEKTQKRAIRDDLVKQMGEVYTEIREVASNCARRNGLQAVFMVNDNEMAARSQEELQALIASRPVLYHEKGLDVTDQILEMLKK